MKELKEKSIWLLYKIVCKSGHKTKVPVSTFTGKLTGTSNNYSNTWTDYNTAISNVNKYGADGVGFVIPTGYFMIDIDKKSIDNPLVKTMLDRFDTYAEYSQSGNGIHIYGKCDLSKLLVDDIKSKLKYYMKNSKLNLELYIGGCTNRFAVFTGNTIKDIPLNDCTDALLETLNNEMLKANTNDKANEIISALRTQKNANKLNDLFNGKF